MSGVDPHSPTFGPYAAADFQDADDTRPAAIQLDPTQTGTLTPYNTLITNAYARQNLEIKEKSSIPQPTNATWRKKFREFMAHKNDDLTAFLRKPLSQHPTLKSAESFMKKFGRSEFNSSHISLQDIVLDASGVSALGFVEEELKKIGPSSNSQIQEQVKWLYDAYRQAGESILRNEGVLKTKLDILDRTYQKVLGFMDLPVNDDTTELSVHIQKYLEKIYTENTLEVEYKAAIESYRRFATLKEMIAVHRFGDMLDKEPLCSICLNEPVTHTVTPCGHTFCQNCCKRQMTQCYMCRTSIRERVRIYFG
jgi:hypothetical protein